MKIYCISGKTSDLIIILKYIFECKVACVWILFLFF